MIKLINYKGNKEGKVIYLAKSVIGEMRRNDEEGVTYIWSNDLQPTEYVVKETPEEILAMPDIEEGNKVLDWEQRRFDLVSALFVKYACSPDNLHYLLNDIIPQADALIDELKKGTEQ